MTKSKRELKPDILKKIFKSSSNAESKLNGEVKSAAVTGSSSSIVKKTIGNKKPLFVKNPNRKASPERSTKPAEEKKGRRESQVEKLRDRLNVGQFR